MIKLIIELQPEDLQRLLKIAKERYSGAEPEQALRYMIRDECEKIFDDDRMPSCTCGQTPCICPF